MVILMDFKELYDLYLIFTRIDPHSLEALTKTQECKTTQQT
jgi:hypothetical protein